METAMMVAGRARTSDPTFEPVTTLADGTRIRLELIGPADRADLIAGFDGLSRRSRYLRFFSAMPTLAPHLVDSLLNTDADRHVAIGARRIDANGRVEPPIIGVARYFRSEGSNDTAEPAVAVVDALHGRGLGRALLKAITRHARSRGIVKMRAHALADNERIRKILTASHGVLVERDGPVMVYDVDIRSQRNRENLVELGKMYRETEPSEATSKNRRG
jgi:GNAT superfamily N-acetyltransferase